MEISVSIVVAVYNAEKFLCVCLDSLINQTYKNIEIICVNDASTDNSQRIIDEYKEKDNRVKSIIHKENKNAGGAMNDGIKAAQGEYVCIVDNDDWMVPNAIELLVDASDNGLAELVASDWVRYFSEDRKIVNKNLGSDLSYEGIIKYTCYNGFRLLGCLWKRSLFIKNNLFFPENVFFEDNAIAMTLICYGAKNLKYIPIPLYYYSMLPTSVTASVSKRKIQDRIITTKMYLDNLKIHGFYEEHKDLFDVDCLKMATGTVELLSKYPYSEVKMEFERNEKIINSCLPNGYIKDIDRIKKLIIKNPRFSFYALKILLPLLPRIQIILRPIKKIVKMILFKKDL